MDSIYHDMISVSLIFLKTINIRCKMEIFGKRDKEYEAANSIYTTEGYHDIKCKNYEICQGTFDHRLVGSSFGIPGYKNYDYLCDNCILMFGKCIDGKGHLQIVDTVECPVCYESKRGVQQPNCTHTICIECFKNCYYGILIEPTFPYSEEIERQCEEYGCITDYPPEFIEKYPLLVEYENEYNKRLDAQEEMIHINGKCPLCRN